MLVKEETSLADFDAWSGGRDVLDELIANGNVSAAEQEIEDLYPDGIDKTQLNDLLWFDFRDMHPEWFDDEEDDEEDEDDDDLDEDIE